MKLIDHLWLWCHNAGVYDNILKGHSDATPAAAAAWFGLKNALMVVYADKPEPPFAPIQRELAGLDRVVWSIIGDTASRRNIAQNDIEEVLGLRREFSNITGGIMDDFFNPKRPAFALQQISRTMHDAGLPLWIVLYDHDLARPNLAEELQWCDVVSFWTWDCANLKHLAENMARVKAVAPDKAVALGCYLWNFNLTGLLTCDHMNLQCEQGRRWLHDGTIDEMILLGSPLVGMNLPTLEWTRDWIAAHAEELIPAKGGAR